MTNPPEESICPKCGAPIPGEAPQGLCPKCVMADAATVPAPTGAGKQDRPPPDVGEVAAHFPDLEVLELVGAGGMGAVFKARQPNLERFVALKILSHDLARDPSFLERFNREARVLAKLSHPNIVTVYDFGNKGPFCFLLMEYVDGVNLRQAMQAGGFTPSDALVLVQDICAALKFAHEEGVLHRDIKPENILIDARGRVKIADFGIAKLIGGDGVGDDFTLTAKGAVLGSVHYMAPEQIEKPGDVDQRADIYSLGVVFYELLTGELPLGRFDPPSQKSAMEDPRVDAVVMRALEKERNRRFQTVGEVKTSVEAITRAGGVEGEEKPGGERAGASPVTGEAPRPSGETARFATAAAVLTGVSFLFAATVLVGAAVFFFKVRSGMNIVGLGVIGVPVFLLVGVPAMLGIFFGFRALAEIRASGGRKRGLGRAMFGGLAWPLLVLILFVSLASAMGFVGVFGTGLMWLVLATVVTVAVGVFVILSVLRWGMGVPRGVRLHDQPGVSGSPGTNIAVAAVIVLVPTLAVLVPWGMFTLIQREAVPHGRPPVELRVGPSGGTEIDRSHRMESEEVEAPTSP